jgi:serine/threonine protein kinase
MWAPVQSQSVRQPVPFGKYLLLDRISVGGMAEVFKAKSYGVEGFEKVIAIKRILPSMGEDRDFIKMFIDEAKIAGQLSHANICQIFELGKIGGSHFIAMEYIWGKDLLQIQNRCKRRGRVVPVAMACYIIAKACEGLHYSHKRRDPMGQPLEIVHRDCSPQNILISYEGEVKVIDFGIARAASRSSRTQAGVLKGKFGYMSPEQVRGLPLDRRSDIFSLGTVLYESLTGERLFVGESDFSTLEKVRNADVTPPSELNKDIPPRVETIVLKALSRDREKRYQWCSEMQADLQSYLTAQADVFASKSLGEEIRELFAKELAREKQQLEQYKRVGRDGLIKGMPSADAERQLEIDDELGEAPPLEGDPTVLGGPDFDAMLADLEPGESKLPAGLRAAAEMDIADAFEENPTEIYGDIDDVARPSPGAAAGKPRPTIAHSSAPPPVVSAGALSPRDLGASQPARPPAGTPTESPRLAPLGGPGTGPGAPRSANPSQPMPVGPNGPGSRPGFDPSGSFASHPAGQAAMTPDYPRHHGPYDPRGRHQTIAAAPLMQSGRRRTNAVRDIAIGVGIAALVLIAFALGRQYLAGGDDGEEQASNGAIAVSVAGVKSAEVLLDGEAAGTAISGDKLMLAAAAGDHEVEVRAGDQTCVRKVTVSGGGVAKIECSLAAAVPPAPDAAPTTVALALDAGVPPADAAEVDDNDRDDADRDETPEQRRKRLEERKKRAEERKERREREQREREKREREKREKELAAKDVGWLVCNSSPFARVIIDGRNTGKMTPMSKAEKIALKPGRHRVTFVVGDDKFTYGVTIVKGKTKTLYRVLKPK